MVMDLHVNGLQIFWKKADKFELCILEVID